MVNKPFEFPPYDPERFPITETFLVLYDMATRWSDENGYPHRDNFRMALQYVEVTGQVEKLRQEEKRLTKELKDLQARHIILKAEQEKKVFRG
jgi:hypothetical protein